MARQSHVIYGRQQSIRLRRPPGKATRQESEGGGIRAVFWNLHTWVSVPSIVARLGRAHGDGSRQCSTERVDSSRLPSAHGFLHVPPASGDEDDAGLLVQ